MRVLVTGGAGFIGANLCSSLAANSAVSGLVALDDLSTGKKENLADLAGVELVEGSILDEALLDALFEDVDSVVHLAARPSVPRSLADPMATHRVNVTGTMEVLEAARRHGRPQVVFASSSSVYGANPALPKREDMVTLPVSPYASSKLAGESAVLAYGRSFGVPALAFRFFNVFGPLQGADHAYAAVVPTFIAAALRGEALPIHGDGNQTRDFTFVGSVVAVLTQAVVGGVADPQPVNLAFGTRVSIIELVEHLESVLGRRLERHHAEPRAGDVRDSQADQSRLRQLFPGIEPVGLEEGLGATVEWFEQHVGS
jgi:UDP-glucose 4-epimerase